MKARQLVLETRRDLNYHTGKTHNHGVLACPGCDGGELSWVVMPNGHIHMSCSTPNCIMWIE